jgi:spondin-2
MMMCLFKFVVVIYLATLAFCFDKSIEHSSFGGNCRKDSLAVYKVTLEGHWSREMFPKHYPETRPPAHFSKTFGITHNDEFTMFEIGKVSNTNLVEFCKSANSELWENDESNEDQIFDEFILPKLENPIDKVEARLFVQSNYSSISMVTKLMPSPDWFIGIESLQVSNQIQLI